MLFPATACFVQKKIGATNAACLDISAACAGFLFGLEIAQQFITSHTHDTVLVIGADKLTSITNWTDRNTCVLFGDGAGAAILRHRGSAHGVICTHIGSDGNYTDILFMVVNLDVAWVCAMKDLQGEMKRHGIKANHGSPV